MMAMTPVQVAAVLRKKATLIAASKNRLVTLCTCVRLVVRALLCDTWGRRLAPLPLGVLFLSRLLSITFDFQIVDTNIAGISQIVPQNEEALTYLVEEAHFSTFKDGTAALF